MRPPAKKLKTGPAEEEEEKLSEKNSYKTSREPFAPGIKLMKVESIGSSLLNDLNASEEPILHFEHAKRQYAEHTTALRNVSDEADTAPDGADGARDVDHHGIDHDGNTFANEYSSSTMDIDASESEASGASSESSSDPFDSSDSEGGKEFYDMHRHLGPLHCLRIAFAKLASGGSYAAFETFHHAPNPWLSVRGAGQFGVPLSERDAKAIMLLASRPNNLDSALRSQWEVEGSRVHFSNPQWKKFVNEAVIKNVCASLGIKVAVRAKLHKLLLCDGESSFLLDDGKLTESTFGTLIVTLPSMFTGGEVTLFHADQSQEFNSAAASLHVSALAWYTGVDQSTRPIHSGYRLALCYRLLSRKAPGKRPQLLQYAKSFRFARELFYRWEAKLWDDTPRFFAHFLEHRYDDLELAKGPQVLKNRDATLMSKVHGLGEELGFRFLLINVTAKVVGTQSYEVVHEGRYDSDAEGNEDIQMGRILQQTLLVTRVFDMDGKDVVEEAFVLPRSVLSYMRPFDKMRPYKARIGTQGKGENTIKVVRNWYYQTALIMFHESNPHDFMLASHSIPYALTMLKGVHPGKVSGLDIETAKWVINRVSHSDAEMEELHNIVLRWKNFELWKQICEKTCFDLPLVKKGEKDKEKQPEQAKALVSELDLCPVLDEEKKERIELQVLYLASGSTAFGLPLVEPFISQVAQEKLQFSLRVAFVKALRAVVSDMDSRESNWKQAYQLDLLDAPCTLSEQDVPILMEMTKLHGVKSVMAKVFSLIQAQGFNWALWNTLREGLSDSSLDLAHPSDSTFTGECRRWSEKCIASMNSQLVAIHSSLVVNQSPYRELQHHTAARILYQGHGEMLARHFDTLLPSRNRADCQRLIDSLTKIRNSYADIFAYIIVPFIIKLKPILFKYNLSFRTSPYREFAQNCILCYLSRAHVLKSNFRTMDTVGTYGCGQDQCEDCTQLDLFLRSPASLSMPFTVQGDPALISHIKSRVSISPRFFKTRINVFTTPHTLIVSRRPETISWDGKKALAHQLLTSIGDGNTIKEIMDDVEGKKLYGQMVSAIEGKKLMNWDKDWLTGCRGRATASTTGVKPGAAGPTQPKKSEPHAKANKARTAATTAAAMASVPDYMHQPRTMQLSQHTPSLTGSNNIPIGTFHQPRHLEVQLPFLPSRPSSDVLQASTSSQRPTGQPRW